MALYTTEEYQRKRADISRRLWQDEGYRKKVMDVFNSDEYRERMAKLGLV